MGREERLSTHTHLCERNPHGGVAKMIIEGVQHCERGELRGIARGEKKLHLSGIVWEEQDRRRERARTKDVCSLVGFWADKPN